MSKLFFFVGFLLLVSLTEISSIFSHGVHRKVRHGYNFMEKIDTEISNELTDTQDRARRNVAEEKDGDWPGCAPSCRK
ncbi:unnamed protein product [Clavelina lepadiformis]|uniref:Uncharacterized protein n=1 Tax=Clavelina lepadiformis TaxID=159417 RepID=A0ABP0GVV4_CLALP